MKIFDYARGLFSRPAPEPVLALPAPVLTEAEYWQAKIDEATAEIVRLRADGADRAEIENARWDRDIAEENLRDVHEEQAREARGIVL